MDVGGGTGNLLDTILHAHPYLQGILYDLPHVVPEARTRIEAMGPRTEQSTTALREAVPGRACPVRCAMGDPGLTKR